MADITTGLIAHWRLNEGVGTTAADELGTHPATLAGGAAWGTGIEGAGLVLDGVNDYLDVSGAGFIFPDDTATFSMWVKLDAATPSDATKTGFVRMDNAVSAYPASHYPFVDGSAYISTLRTARVDGIALSGTVNRTAWHLVTITTTPGANGWKLYQNDQLIHQTTGEAAVALNAAVAWLGRTEWPGGSANYYIDGQIDDVRLYSRALTAEDVAALYANAGAAGGAAVDLAGAGSAQASAAAGLSQAIPLAAAAAIVTTATGAVALTLSVGGAAQNTAAASGGLNLATPLAGAAQGAAGASASLATQIAAPDESGCYGDVTFGNCVYSGGSAAITEAALTGAATATVTASGDLAIAIPLAGAAIAAAAAQGGLNIATPLAGAAVAQAAATGAIGLTVSLSGAALAQAVADAGLSVQTPGQVDLSGSAQAAASAAGSLAMDIPLAGAASITVTGAGNLTHLVPLAGVAAVAASATGGLDVTAAVVNLSGAALAAAQAGGVLTLRINLSGAALAQALAAGLLSAQGLILAADSDYDLTLDAYDYQAVADDYEYEVAA